MGGLTPVGRGWRPRFRCRRAGWLGVAWLVVVPVPTVAHPDTWHTIELLSAQIDGGDRRPAVYFARGEDFRSVQEYAKAEADLRECLRLDPEFFHAQLGLASLLRAGGRLDEARAAACRAAQMSAGRAAVQEATAWAEVARIEASRHAWPEVLSATDRSLRLVPRGEAEWYLLREDAFRSQGRLDDAIADLARGASRLGSALVTSAWVDALLDAGRAEEALPLIEARRADTSFQAPWLVRRGRARARLGQPGAARTDWEEAVRQVDSRLVPDEPDPGLLLTKGLALAGLGRGAEAAALLARARVLLPDPRALAPLERMLGPPGDRPDDQARPAAAPANASPASGALNSASENGTGPASEPASAG